MTRLPPILPPTPSKEEPMKKYDTASTKFSLTPEYYFEISDVKLGFGGLKKSGVKMLSIDGLVAA